MQIERKCTAELTYNKVKQTSQMQRRNERDFLIFQRLYILFILTDIEVTVVRNICVDTFTMSEYAI